MSSLSPLNQAKLEDIFQMDYGSVGNYSNRSFQSLIIKITGIDVYEGEYNTSPYSSKAKKLRHFIDIETDQNVGKVLIAMLDERDIHIQRCIDNGVLETDPYEQYVCDLREAALAMTGDQRFSSNEERLNADLATARMVLDDLIYISQMVCNNVLYDQNTKENNINDYYRDLLKVKGYEQAHDQTRHGLSSSGKDAASVDLLLNKGEREVAIIEALRLDCIRTQYIKEHIDKAITNYNALGTPTFLLIYAGSPHFNDFWGNLLEHLKNYCFALECKKSISEYVHPNAAMRVCDCIMSRDGFDFPVTFLVVNVFK